MSTTIATVPRVSSVLTRTALSLIAFVCLSFVPSEGVAQQVQGDWTPEADFAVSGEWKVKNLRASCANDDPELDCCDDSNAYEDYPRTNVFLVREGFPDWSNINC